MDGTWTIVLQQGAHGSSGRTDRPGATASCAVVGTLWLSHSRGRLSSAFRYDPAWLAAPSAFAISPDLPLTAAAASCEGLFCAFQDCTPDRWGRRLLQCAETAAARRQQRSPRTLLDSDFLVQVPDSIRQGALRLLADTGRAASRLWPVCQGCLLPRWLSRKAGRVRRILPSWSLPAQPRAVPVPRSP